MKLINSFTITFAGICMSGILALTANAQPPSAITGDAARVDVTGGSGTFTNKGHYLILLSNSGTAYQTIGVGGAASTTGSYHYSTAGNSASLNLIDNSFGIVGDTFAFSDADSGTFALTANGGKQSGGFEFATGPAPAALTKHSYIVTIQDGTVPFASNGVAVFSPTSDSQYIVMGMNGVGTSTGSYSYSKANNSTGTFALSDSLTGDSTEYFSYQGTNHGFYLVSGGASGFQVGDFAVVNLVPAAFFLGQVDLNSHVEYLQFSTGNAFGYYTTTDFDFPLFYHLDMGFEYYFDANDGVHGCFLYDFSSQTFFYTNPQSWPYLFDFSLNHWLFYFPDQTKPGRMTSKPRQFYDIGAGGTIITK